MPSRKELKEEARQRRIESEKRLRREPNIDNKYGEVTTEFGEFIPGEPVIVFRARDGQLPALLMKYYGHCLRAGSPAHHLDLIQETLGQITNWQTANRDQVRVPNSDSYMNRERATESPD